MSTLAVTITGVAGIRRALRPLLEPELSKELDAATRSAARVYAKALRSELRPVSRRMARAVRVKRARRERPGWIVGSNRKIAPFWPYVIRGTRDHGPKKAKMLVWTAGGRTITAHRVRGVPANPIVQRVADRVEARALADAERQFVRGTGL